MEEEQGNDSLEVLPVSRMMKTGEKSDGDNSPDAQRGEPAASGKSGTVQSVFFEKDGGARSRCEEVV